MLVWYTDTLSGSAYMEAMSIGFGIGYEAVRSSLPEYLNSLAQNAYPYRPGGRLLSASGEGIPLTKASYAHDILHLRVQGAVADNAAPSILPSEIVRAWNEEWVYPTLRLSTDRDFFEDAEARIGSQLDTFSGDWTDWWADGIGSAASALGKNRRSQSDLRTAQTLHAVADALTNAPNPAIPDEVQRAYEDIALFDEHTWGAANPWERGEIAMASGEHQWLRKAGFAYTAEERVATLLGGGRQRVANLARRPGHAANDEALLVFNPNSWERSDLVQVFLPERSREVSACRLFDCASGAVVPFVVEPQVNPAHRPRGQFIRFLARSIPPLGYARYVLTPDGEAGTDHDEDADPTSIVNEYLAVKLDASTGSIATITDLRDGRLLNDPDAPFGFNRYIHDRYTSAPGFNHLSSRIGTAGPWLLGKRSMNEYGLITSRVSNAVWDQVTIRSSSDGVDWLETTLTLPHGLPRLQIANRLHKPATMEKESVYYAFPFAPELEEPSFEITGGVVFVALRTCAWVGATLSGNPALGDAGGSGATARLVGGDGGATGPGRNHPSPVRSLSGIDPERHTAPSTIYSWALNNIWDTNFPAQQGGELTFRYAVAVGTEEMPASALGRDTGASVSVPLIGIRAPDYEKSSTAVPDRGSFVTVANPEIEITHLAPTGDGGTVLHLESHASRPVTTTVAFGILEASSARIGSFLGTGMRVAEIRDRRIELDIAPGEIRTIALTP